MTSSDAGRLDIGLACNFEPLTLVRHLARAVTARASATVDVRQSGFGGLESMLREAGDGTIAVARVIAIVEWGDLDPRLGLRSEVPLTRAVLDAVVHEARATAERIATALARLGDRAVLVLPTLAMPPFFPTRPVQASSWQAALRAIAAQLGERAAVAGVSVLDVDACTLPVAARASARNEVRFGFPYAEPHAKELASLVAELVVPPARRKGLVLDLDGTLWRGIVGDDGADGVSWRLDDGALAHALLQRVAGLLADSGTLVGVVTKNEPAAAEAGLARADLLVPRDALWPVVAGWEQKSVGVRRVAASWNIGTDAMAMLDDSPLELAEIEREVPGLVPLRFIADDPDAVVALLQRLRAEFGAARTSAEDALRAQSLRSQAELTEVDEADVERHEAFLAGLEPELRIARVDATTRARAIELVNKTNQFNLDGRRVTPADEAHFLGAGETYVVEYADRLARLGIIGVVRLDATDDTLEVTHWVLSCRAFARRIEHAILAFVAARAGGRRVRLPFAPTAKNAPTARFLETVTGTSPTGMLEIDPQELLARLPAVRPTPRDVEVVA